MLIVHTNSDKNNLLSKVEITPIQSWERAWSSQWPHNESAHTHKKEPTPLLVRKTLRTFSAIPRSRDFIHLLHRHQGHTFHKHLSLVFSSPAHFPSFSVCLWPLFLVLEHLNHIWILKDSFYLHFSGKFPWKSCLSSYRSFPLWTYLHNNSIHRRPPTNRQGYLSSLKAAS